jgi:hypothetical protein
MAQMTPFKYSGFYDVPRYMVLHYRGRFLLLQSAFDDELDEYASNYSVYVLPESVADSVREGRWDFFNNAPMVEIGHIPISAVVFDQTSRRELDAACLDDLIGGWPTLSREV